MTTQNSSRTLPFLMICLIGFLGFFSSYLRIPVMPLYAASLGGDPAQIGMINGAFMLTAGLLSIPSGLLADRVGRKPPLVAGLIAMAASSLLVAHCRLPVQMAGAYVLFGCGLALFAPGMMSLVADVVAPEKLGRSYGWYTTAVYSAMTVGPATGGFLAALTGLRQVFLISGGMSLAVAAAALPALPRGTVRHRAELHSVLGGMAELVRNRFLVACLAATAGSCIGFGVFLTFLPLLSAARGFGPSQAGTVLAAQALTNVVCRIPIGAVADRSDRRLIAAAGLLVLSVALVMLGQVAGSGAMLLCAVLLGGGMALTYTAIGAMIARQVPAVRRGLAMGMYNSCIYLGMMAGSVAMGAALKKISYPAAFAWAGAVVLAALAGFMLLLRGAASNGAEA